MVAALACVALAQPIANYVAAPQLAFPIAVSAPYVVFTSLAGVQVGILTGLEAFAISGRLVAFEGVLTALLVIAAAWTRGVTAAVLAMTVASAITFFVRQHFVRDACRRAGIVVRHRGVAGEMQLLRRLAVPAMLFAIAAQPFAWLARAMVARGAGGLRELGIFAAAFAWGAAVMEIPAQVTRPAMPILTNVLAAGDRAAYRKLLREVCVLAFVAASLVALPLIFVSPWIMRAYGSSFSSGAVALSLIAISSVLGAVGAGLRSALLAAGAAWGQAAQSLMWGVTLVAAFFGMRTYGATGLAAAYIVAYGTSVAIQLGMLLRMDRKPSVVAAMAVPDAA